MERKISRYLPSYCDYSCKYAAFAGKNLSGACNREAAVYCNLLRKYNNKNAKCLVEENKKKKEAGRK
jgi:hypothetical protein